MQAEHIPVHLGSMPDAVAAVLDEEQRPGDAWILNDPYRGGTHLPDITLISPVFARRPELLGFAASRAHHADVGGPTPGGMPADSTHARGGGRGHPADPRRPTRCSSGLAAQMRNPRQRLADLRAQRAANRTGERRLAELAERHGPDVAARRDGRDPRLRRAPHPRRARRAARRHATRPRTCSRTTPAARSATSACASSATIDGDRLTLDFTGTDAQVEGNLNCPLSVTKSAAFFAVRVLTDPDAPPSAGAFRPDRGDRARRAACSTRGRRPPSPPATSRPRAASPTW